MRSRRLACFALLVALSAAGACSSGSDSATDDGASGNAAWAAEVVPWITQFGVDVRDQGGFGALPYLADDVVIDIRTVATFGNLLTDIDGAVAYFDAITSGMQPTVRRVAFGDTAYVDLGGLVLPVVYDRSVQPGTTPLLPGYSVLFVDVGPDGIERYQMLPSTDWWRASDRTGRTEPADAAVDMTSAWTDAWSGDDADRLAELYSPAAVFVDEVAGVAVSGRRAIVDQWTFAPSTTWEVVVYGDTPAVHLWSPRHRDPLLDRASLGVLAELDGSADGDCPGGMAVWWELNTDGQITLERRFRSVADVRACSDANETLPTGWWSGLEPPGSNGSAPEDLGAVTQQITENDLTVDIRNGTPSLAALVGWGLSRFDLAELPLPTVRSVTFTEYTDYCREVEGRTLRIPDEDPVSGAPTAGGWEIVLCMNNDDVYIDARASELSARVRFIMLHELAHAWTGEYVDEARNEHLMEWLELPTWNDRDVPWDQRGTEWAASFIAWGLMDEPMPLYELDDPLPDVRFDGFQLLTGHRPLQPEPERQDITSAPS